MRFSTPPRPAHRKGVRKVSERCPKRNRRVRPSSSRGIATRPFADTLPRVRCPRPQPTRGEPRSVRSSTVASHPAPRAPFRRCALHSMRHAVRRKQNVSPLKKPCSCATPGSGEAQRAQDIVLVSGGVCSVSTTRPPSRSPAHPFARRTLCHTMHSPSMHVVQPLPRAPSEAIVLATTATRTSNRHLRCYIPQHPSVDSLTSRSMCYSWSFVDRDASDSSV